MAFELVMRLGQPFSALIGSKDVTLPLNGEIRVQFTDEASARLAFAFLRGNTFVRPCRDEGEGHNAPVIQGQVVKDRLDIERSAARAIEAGAVEHMMRRDDAGDQQH